MYEGHLCHNADITSNTSTLCLVDLQVLVVFLTSLNCTLSSSLKPCYSKEIRGAAAWYCLGTC